MTTTAYDVAVIGLGALGSATAYQLAARGATVIGFEQFELGHHRGASHDTSRILRRSYHTPAYVRLANEAYDDWHDLSQAAGEPLVTTTGGLDFFPSGAAIPITDYTGSLNECGVSFEVLDVSTVNQRWPQIVVPTDTVTVFQADTGIVHAAKTVRVLQRLAAERGAHLVSGGAVQIGTVDHSGVDLLTGDGMVRCGRVVVTADAWTNQVLAAVDLALPLTVTQEQVSYFAPAEPAAFSPDRFPVWIWMDDPSFYGFPTYTEALVKAGQDVGGRVTTATDRSFEPDRGNESQLRRFMASTFPGCAEQLVRTVTCLYTLTPDRDFVADLVPGQPRVVVGLGAGHGFKFTPTFGRVLADLALDGGTTSDIAAFGLDRPALTEPDVAVSWLV